MMKRRTALLILVWAVMICVAGCARKKELILATTTSTQDSGLLDVLIPVFEKKNGVFVKTIAVGSGQAMAMGERGEADVLLVHSPEAEKTFMDKGFGINRQRVMHNDFILLGPAEDPAKVKEMRKAPDALKRIAAGKALFVSRGDRSGTHSRELKIWKAAAVKAAGQSWYQETGLGMGATLNVAAEKKGYTISDRATYLALKKNLSLVVLLEGDESLLNIYHVIQVNPQKYSRVHAEAAAAFAAFLISSETQGVIGNFGKEKYGAPLFYADALK